jgi:serpin B
MQQIFHSPDGDRACRFMRRADENTLYEGKGFRAAGVDLSGGGMMYFLLPDEGLTPEELLSKKEALAFLLGPTGRGNTDGGQVLLNLAVPEFDVSAETDLIFRLQELGVTAVFDPERSDFSPLTTDTEASITVSKADHGARVTLDEKGISGAAYTILEATKAGLPEELEEVELTLDRPFLFVITNNDGLPLFVGVVNEP